MLEAARKVFLRHGYKATTAQVAREAGVSEGSLFKHFKSKTDLFLTAMQVESAQMAWQERLTESVGTGDLRQLLEFAGLQVLKRLQIAVPRMMMLRSSGLLSPTQCHHIGGIPPPVHHIRALSTYFHGEMKHGRLRMEHPESQAHAFYGAIAHYVFFENLFGSRPASPKAYVGTVVDTILRASATGAGVRVRDLPVRRPSGVHGGGATRRTAQAKTP